MSYMTKKNRVFIIIPMVVNQYTRLLNIYKGYLHTEPSFNTVPAFFYKQTSKQLKVTEDSTWMKQRYV